MVGTLLLFGLTSSQMGLARPKPTGLPLLHQDSMRRRLQLQPDYLDRLPGASLLSGFPEVQRERLPFMGLEAPSLSHSIDLGAFLVAMLAAFVPSVVPALRAPVMVIPILGSGGVGLGLWGRLK